MKRMSMHRTTGTRGRRGQSTVEFALMMPVIMAFFFWIFETNIYWIGLHQGAYAAYAASRTHLVDGGPTDVDPEETMEDLLTGQLWKGGFNGRNRPSLSTSTLRTGGGPDGVIITMPALSTLPYIGLLLEFDSEVSTHLGWSEYDETKYPNSRERECAEPFGCRMVTDNNLRDYN